LDQVKLLLTIPNEKIEEIVAYNEVLDYINDQDQTEKADQLWKFRAITAHQGPLAQTDPNYKGSSYNVLVEWETGEKA
jgi:hypothetical protein